MFRTRNLIYSIITLMGFVFLLESCKKIVEVEEPHGGFVIDTDTAWNSLRMECLNPAENRVFSAHQYKEQAAGFRDLYLTEFLLADSVGNKNYKLRIYSHLRALTDSAYQTTDNNYNPFDDKVYVEFYKENDVTKDELYVSMLQQTENYFVYKSPNENSKILSFQYLAKFSNPDRYAKIKGKFRLSR